MLSVAERLASKYALAMFEIATEQQTTDASLVELEKILNILKTNSELEGFVNNPLVPKISKKEVLKEVLAGEVSAVVMNFLFILVDKNRITLYESICKAYHGFINKRDGIEEVKVTTARPLDKTQEEHIKTRVGKMLNKNIILNKRVDARIMGGIIIQVCDKLIDGSISRRLKNIERSIKSIDMREIGVTK